jgi:hypothetical protein
MREHARRDSLDTRFRQHAFQRAQRKGEIFTRRIEFESQFAAFSLRLTHINAKRRMKQRAYALSRRLAIREMRQRQNAHSLTRAEPFIV